MLVGITSLQGNAPLYCHIDGDGFFVINGGWRLTRGGRIKDTDGYSRGSRSYMIVLKNMEHFKDYNDACPIIEKAAQEVLAGKRKSIPVEEVLLKAKKAKEQFDKSEEDDIAF